MYFLSIRVICFDISWFLEIPSSEDSHETIGFYGVHHRCKICSKNVTSKSGFHEPFPCNLRRIHQMGAGCTTSGLKMVNVLGFRHKWLDTPCHSATPLPSKRDFLVGFCPFFLWYPLAFHVKLYFLTIDKFIQAYNAGKMCKTAILLFGKALSPCRSA